MVDWETLHKEAAGLAEQLLRLGVDLSEAQKLGDYFVYQNYDLKMTGDYLTQMSQNPPPRSKKSCQHFQNLNNIWKGWRTKLAGHDRAMAWGWAVRLAKTKRAGV